eukprot:CAMPEP_0185025594 /NCGR_PEP_ID=MMETSP1103-20130426/8494_1 /TAXON_ID=36769 /ORGANISM="Paraphysomonas bandaiensis, Strain Caron Lab Isolate" /LENGTH=268 /DNA_ID=CAMNT_0027558831 /DNA_START=238 /DNA_END=1044 /DNA_ORIENTATION=-
MSMLLTAVISQFTADSSCNVIDIGSNIGWFSLLAASKECNAIAIEASPVNTYAISRSILKNNYANKIELHNAALSVELGGSVCLKNVHGPPGRVGDLVLTANNFHHGRDGQKCKGSGVVEVVPLDALTPGSAGGVTVLKAACGGCEPRAILGARSMFSGPSPPCFLMLEWNHASTVDLEGAADADKSLVDAGKVLEDAGYKFFHPRYHANASRVDIVSADSKDSGFWTRSFHLLGIHPSERCFPPTDGEESAKWNLIKKRLSEGSVVL